MSKAKGDAFRDKVAQLLEAAGYHNVTTEKVIGGKKTDVYGERRIGFATQRVAIEAKDYKGTLPLQEVFDFSHAYGGLRRQGSIDQAVLVSSGMLSSQGQEHLEAARNEQLVGMTFQAFQRCVFGPDDYLRAVIEEYEQEGLDRYYIPARSPAGNLADHVEQWLRQPDNKPLVALGGYGVGKSTFALHLTAQMARRSLEDPTTRIPIRVPLGFIVDENSMSGLFGKLFTDSYRVESYTWPLFRRLNRLGRFLVIFDGFDEMKHGMTFAAFQRQFDQLLSLSECEAKVLILGRPTAFADDREFRAVIDGRVTTASGTEVRLPDRPECEHVEIAPFTLEEARTFVRGYLPFTVKSGSSTEWLNNRLDTLLSGQFDDLLVRPVHAQMLCRIATDAEEDFVDLDEFGLYDRFVHHLLRREVRKQGRYGPFDEAVRRRANAALAWWMLARGGASTTTIVDAPVALFRQSVEGVNHHFDDTGLVRELSQGCLIEKGGGTIYFGHRSIQEFLAAEHLYDTKLFPWVTDGSTPTQGVGARATPEVVEFLAEFFKRRPDGEESARKVVGDMDGLEVPIDLDAMGPYAVAFRRADLSSHEALRSASVFWVNWVSRFGPPSTATAPGAVRLPLSLVQEATDDDEITLASVLLLCHLAARSLLNDVTFDAAALIAALVEPDFLISAIGEVRRTRSQVYVKSLRTRLLAVATEPKRALNKELIVELNFTRLHREAGKVLGYTPRSKPWGEIQARPTSFVMTASVQRVLLARGARLAQADRLRPYFDAGERVHQFISPEVEVVSKNQRRGRREARI